MNIDEILKKLKNLSDPKSLQGMVRYGISPAKALGVTIPRLREMAKEIGKNHKLAEELWRSGYHEGRILGSMIDDKDEVTEEQLESWVSDFDSWDLCDQCVMNLFAYTPFAWDKAIEWSKRREEFTKRAAFSMMARLAVSDKSAGNERFAAFFPIISRESTDDRNFVKKAVNWALRQIGKRNLKLNAKAIEVARSIEKKDSKSARWIARDALRELSSDAVKKRLHNKTKSP